MTEENPHSSGAADGAVAPADDSQPGVAEAAHTPRYRAWITVSILVVFAAALGFKLAAPMNAGLAELGSGPAKNASAPLSEARGDANAAYEAALAGGQPVYVLFHSLTCDSCKEISAVVDEVLPSYEGRVVFVNAITDDAGAQQLASRFQFQYIPTSFFVDGSGNVVSSFTGMLDDVEMRARLDQLVSQ